jgi:hypothetical protein
MNVMSSDERPSLVAQIARIAQTTAVVASPVLSRPHLASLADAFASPKMTSDPTHAICSRTDTQKTGLVGGCCGS